MFKRLFGCFRPDFRPPVVHPKPPSPVPTPILSPAPTPKAVEVERPLTTTRSVSTLEVLQEKETQLRKKLEALEKQIAQLRTTAKAHKLEGKTNHALLCLKKSKMLENSVTAMSNMIMKIVEQQGALESAQTVSATMTALSGATNATKIVMDGYRIEQVDEVMQTIQDNADDLQEVNERLAESTGIFAGVDDADLLAELDAELENDGLLAEAEEADMLNNRRSELPVLREAERVNSALPPAPTHPIVIETRSRNRPMARQNLNLQSA